MSKAVRRTPASDRRLLPELEKYVALAKRLKMVDALIISPSEICFDIRALLKCRWGCDDLFQGTVRCHDGGTTLAERMEMVKSYNREAFLDGHYFAFAIRTCNLCRACRIKKGGPCPSPEKVRPCSQMFGIDIFKTVRRLGLPCETLRQKRRYPEPLWLRVARLTGEIRQFESAR